VLNADIENIVLTLKRNWGSWVTRIRKKWELMKRTHTTFWWTLLRPLRFSLFG